MGLFRRGRKTGPELFRFFLENDRQLQPFLQTLSPADLLTMGSGLEEGLSCQTIAEFELVLMACWVQALDAVPDSFTSDWHSAALRMLGYEYEQRWKGSMDALGQTMPTVYAAWKAQPQASGPLDETGDALNLFSAAGLTASDRIVDEDDLNEEFEALMVACLSGGVSAATLLAAEGNPGGTGTEDLLAEIAARVDSSAADAAVSALALYYALATLGPNHEREAADGWLFIVWRSLKSRAGHVDPPWAEVVKVFDSHKTWSAENGAFLIVFCRWVDACIGRAWTDNPELPSTLLVMRCCQEGRTQFRSMLDALS